MNPVLIVFLLFLSINVAGWIVFAVSDALEAIVRRLGTHAEQSHGARPATAAEAPRQRRDIRRVAVEGTPPARRILTARHVQAGCDVALRLKAS